MTLKVGLCLALWGTAKLSCKVAVLFYIPISNEWELFTVYLPYQHLVFPVFWILTILIGMQWYLIVLIAFPWWCMLWSIFSYAFLPSIYFLWWGVYKHFWPIFLIGFFLFPYRWFLRGLCMFWIIVLYQMCLLEIFPSVCDLSYSFEIIFCRVKGLYLNKVQLIKYSLHGSCLWCCI